LSEQNHRSVHRDRSQRISCVKSLTVFANAGAKEGLKRGILFLWGSETRWFLSHARRGGGIREGPVEIYNRQHVYSASVGEAAAAGPQPHAYGLPVMKECRKRRKMEPNGKQNAGLQVSTP